MSQLLINCTLFCKCLVTADQLWKGMLATTGKAARKARGKRPARRMKKDLNRGQMVGEGM